MYYSLRPKQRPSLWEPAPVSNCLEKTKQTKNLESVVVSWLCVSLGKLGPHFPDHPLSHSSRSIWAVGDILLKRWKVEVKPLPSCAQKVGAERVVLYQRTCVAAYVLDHLVGTSSNWATAPPAHTGCPPPAVLTLGHMSVQLFLQVHLYHLSWSLGGTSSWCKFQSVPLLTLANSSFSLFPLLCVHLLFPGAHSLDIRTRHGNESSCRVCNQLSQLLKGKSLKFPLFFPSILPFIY